MPICCGSLKPCILGSSRLASHKHVHPLQEVEGELSVTAVQQFGVESPCVFLNKDGPEAGARTFISTWRVSHGHPPNAGFGCVTHLFNLRHVLLPHTCSDCGTCDSLSRGMKCFSGHHRY